MKSLLLGVLVFFGVMSYAQTKIPEKGDIVKLNKQIKVKSTESIYNGNSTSNDLTYLHTWVKFKIVEIDDSSNPKLVLLKALNFNMSDKKIKRKRKKNASFVSKKEEYNDKIYTVNKTEFFKYAYVPETKESKSDIFSIGLLTLPFKARPISDKGNDLRFDTEFNFNSTLNWCFGNWRDIKFNIQAGGGIGSVGIDPSTADGLAVTGEGEESRALDVATLTVLSGIMMQYKKVQVGVYAGVDYINNNPTYQWNHNGDIWLGFGIGFSVFEFSLGKESSDTTNNEK